MKVVKTRIYKSFGTLMQEDTYDNGAIMRYPTTTSAAEPEETDLLDENEEALLEIQTDIEYLVNLTEMNMEV